MTILARLASIAAALLYASADAVDAFGRSLTVQQQRCPTTVPADWRTR